MEITSNNSNNSSISLFRYINSENISDYGPMPPQGTDLSKSFLTQEQRIWLGHVVMTKRFKASELAKKWNMTTNKVRRHATKLRKGIIPSESVGRPTVLDREAQVKVRQTVLQLGVRYRRESEPDFDREFTETYKRRRLALENVENVELHMHRRTRNHYFRKIAIEEGLLNQ